MRRMVEEMGWGYSRAYVVRSDGPTRVVTDEPDPKFVPRPVGFTARIEPLAIEPLVWDGDGA